MFLFFFVTLFPKDPDVILSSLVYLPFTSHMKVANKTKQSKLAQAVTSDLYSGSTEFLHDLASRLIVNRCITTTNSLQQDLSQDVNSSWPFWPVNMKALSSLRTPGTTQRHAPQELNFKNDAMTACISQANSQWNSHQVPLRRNREATMEFT